MPSYFDVLSELLVIKEHLTVVEVGAWDFTGIARVMLSDGTTDMMRYPVAGCHARTVLHYPEITRHVDRDTVTIKQWQRLPFELAVSDITQMSAAEIYNHAMEFGCGTV